MGDKKYVRLDPAKMGYKVYDTLPVEQHSLFFNSFECLKRNIGARRWNYRLNAKRIFWINLWQEDQDEIIGISDSKIARALDKWCRQAVRKYCERNAIIDGY